MAAENRVFLKCAWRLVPLLLVMIGAAHFNRISISVAGAEVIIPREGIDEKQMGWVYTAFLLVYTLGMAPGGCSQVTLNFSKFDGPPSGY